jgi:P2-related tail formation protein
MVAMSCPFCRVTVSLDAWIQLWSKKEKLMINAVSAEPEAPRLKKTAQAVADAIEELGAFLSAKEVCYTSHVPSEWKSALH